MILDVMYVRNWSSRQTQDKTSHKGTDHYSVSVCLNTHMMLAGPFLKGLNAWGCAIISLPCQSQPLDGRYFVIGYNYTYENKQSEDRI